MTKKISNIWMQWVEDNLKLGCSPHSLLEVMIKEGIDAESAESVIAHQIKCEINGVKHPLNNQYTYEASHIQAANCLSLAGQSVAIALRLTQPDIVLINNFLSNDECEILIQQAKLKLKPSTVVDLKTGGRQIHQGRTSEGMHFNRGENALIQNLEHRISELVHMPIEHGEGIQVLHYKMGAEYRPHYDYFPEDEIGSKDYLSTGGQRVATVIMYLNDVEEGGETVFPEISLTVIPKRGSALYFSYCNALNQTDEKTLHGGAPVIKGSKWIATKWLRRNFF